MQKPTTLRLYGTAPDSIVDGPGLRYSVFVQGCSHACPECHNPDSQPAASGTETAIARIVADIQANGLVHDVTLSGGEPFEQAPAVATLAQQLKELGYGIWTYTGYLYEDLLRIANSAKLISDQAPRQASSQASSQTSSSALDPQAVSALLDATDVLVDGPFVAPLKSLGLMWRGSSNQRLIDVPATRACGSIVLWETHDDFPQKPPSW